MYVYLSPTTFGIRICRYTYVTQAFVFAIKFDKDRKFLFMNRDFFTFGQCGRDFVVRVREGEFSPLVGASPSTVSVISDGERG